MATPVYLVCAIMRLCRRTCFPVAFVRQERLAGSCASPGIFKSWGPDTVRSRGSGMSPMCSSCTYVRQVRLVSLGRPQLRCVGALLALADYLSVEICSGRRWNVRILRV